MNDSESRLLIETAERSKSNTHRINRLEGMQEAISDLAKSVAVMAAEQKTTGRKLDTLTHKVGSLEAVPANRWNAAAEKIITLVTAAVVGYFLSRAGL